MNYKSIIFYLDLIYEIYEKLYEKCNTIIKIKLFFNKINVSDITSEHSSKQLCSYKT